MGRLANDKAEIFAQGLARGMKKIKAYTAAGYAPHRANASTMSVKPEIAERVSELKAERQEAVQKGLMVPPVRGEITKYDVAELTIETLQQELVENLQRARDLGQMPAANKAVELLLKSVGGVPSRSYKRGKKNDTNTDTEPTINMAFFTKSLGELDLELGREPSEKNYTTITDVESVGEPMSNNGTGEPIPDGDGVSGEDAE